MHTRVSAQRASTGQGVALRRSDPERQSESGRRSRWRGTVSASGLSRLTAWSTGSLSTAKAQRRVLVVVIVVLREAWKQQRKRRQARRVECEQRRALRARLYSACERRTARPPLAVSRAWTWATLCLRRRRRCGWHHVRRTMTLILTYMTLGALAASAPDVDRDDTGCIRVSFIRIDPRGERHSGEGWMLTLSNRSKLR